MGRSNLNIKFISVSLLQDGPIYFIFEGGSYWRNELNYKTSQLVPFEIKFLSMSDTDPSRLVGFPRNFKVGARCQWINVLHDKNDIIRVEGEVPE